MWRRAGHVSMYDGETRGCRPRMDDCRGCSLLSIGLRDKTKSGAKIARLISQMKRPVSIPTGLFILFGLLSC